MKVTAIHCQLLIIFVCVTEKKNTLPRPDFFFPIFVPILEKFDEIIELGWFVFRKSYHYIDFSTNF